MEKNVIQKDILYASHLCVCRWGEGPHQGCFTHLVVEVKQYILRVVPVPFLGSSRTLQT